MQLVDSHCHVQGPEFDSDRKQVIQKAREAGVRYIVAVGTGADYEEIGRALQFAESEENIFATAGIHPHDAVRFLESDLGELRRIAGHQKALAIGEIGLDYHYVHSQPQDQQRLLIRQLELGRELKLPVVIHCRDAWQDLRRIIDQHWKTSGFGGVLHCFTGSREDAFSLMDCGFMVSFAGNVTYKSAEGLRAVARDIPIDKMLSETDSPYLPPVPYRGRRNEPIFVAEVVRQLATLHGVSEDEMARRVMENFCSFFSLHNAPV
jgi:TatD DNase family protein